MLCVEPAKVLLFVFTQGSDSTLLLLYLELEKTACVIRKAEIETLLVAEQKKEEEPEMENPPCHTLGWGITVEGFVRFNLNSNLRI